jgi:hypothetical protein
MARISEACNSLCLSDFIPLNGLKSASTKKDYKRIEFITNVSKRFCYHSFSHSFAIVLLLILNPLYQCVIYFSFFSFFFFFGCEAGAREMAKGSTSIIKKK